MDHQGPGVTHYVSVSVERGQVKTSCSAYLTAGEGSERTSVMNELTDAMARSMSVAAMARQSVIEILETPVPADVLGAFVARVNQIAADVANGG